MRIETLNEVNEDVIIQLNALLAQLSESRPTIDTARLRELVSDKNLKIIVAIESGKIVGTGSLVLVDQLTTKKGSIEDVVVDEAYRGQGLGKAIMNELIAIAKESGAKKISLTSRPTRTAANALYPKLGFKLKETNFYELELL
ncbi:MAG: GNAT family N-acetyltransferase [Candidatus Harrisonbacteria bacterium CG10_big_fil_rev_8_21_14_0_10_49_15]|uniref:GNAT family N-acetyltransferase n=1 Tax=Candidatus Harrisonbacteria bacterium CG10_big_fil_rev_8_21_14_0_10_49_15 TaxID=1974587 RepID=A0A2H0UM56_9BACT|nr:MAG: GNAT family N-acetyltransferase [Candidatus Harrisonbacteria bacterium CG10_big_fil_rev_8_21_14_0_10_49_15]